MNPPIPIISFLKICSKSTISNSYKVIHHRSSKRSEFEVAELKYICYITYNQYIMHFTKCYFMSHSSSFLLQSLSGTFEYFRGKIQV